MRVVINSLILIILFALNWILTIEFRIYEIEDKPWSIIVELAQLIYNSFWIFIFWIIYMIINMLRNFKKDRRLFNIDKAHLLITLIILAFALIFIWNN